MRNVRKIIRRSRRNVLWGPIRIAEYQEGTKARRRRILQSRKRKYVYNSKYHRGI